MDFKDGLAVFATAVTMLQKKAWPKSDRTWAAAERRFGRVFRCRTTDRPG